MQFKTQFNFEPKFEVSDPKLITEPGLAMDVPTMIRRYAQGTLSGLSVRNPVFDDLDEPDPTETPGFDLTDADAYLRHISDKVAYAQRRDVAPSEEKPVEKKSEDDNSVTPPKAENEP